MVTMSHMPAMPGPCSGWHNSEKGRSLATKTLSTKRERRAPAPEVALEPPKPAVEVMEVVEAREAVITE